MSVFSSQDYVKLLLTTPSRTQAIALLDTATDNQISSLSDIAKNLLLLPLSPRAKRVVEKRKGLLKKISNYSLSYRQRGSLLSKHYRLVLEVLSAVKHPLLKLLKDRNEKGGADFFQQI